VAELDAAMNLQVECPRLVAGCRRSGRRVRPFGEREQKMASIAQDAHLPAPRRVGRLWRAEHAIEER
jgi:hypothetical protein